MQRVIIILLSCLFVFGCQDMQHSAKPHDVEGALEVEQEFAMLRTMAPPPPPPPPLEETTIPSRSKIIKSGSMNFEVNKLEVSKIKIDSILSQYQGYYENEQYTSYGNRNSFSLRLRIPNAKFDSLIYVLEQGVGKLIEKNIDAQDVTEEYVDLKIRLENNLAYLKQYKEILKTARTVKDILEVQEKIRGIEEEIESKMGRIKFLDDKVNYSTLNIEIGELIIRELAKVPSFFKRLGNAFNNGVQGFLSFIVGIVNMWPFLILAMIIFVGRKPLMNKVRWRKGNSD